MTERKPSTRVAKPKPEPGPKPDFLVVEDHLYCQTNEGEKVLDLRVSLPKLELFMSMDELDIPDSKSHRWIMENILNPEDKKTLDSMLDGAKALNIITRYVNTLGERMGADLGTDLGESAGSSDSSVDTDEPSPSISDDTSPVSA